MMIKPPHHVVKPALVSILRNDSRFQKAGESHLVAIVDEDLLDSGGAEYAL